MLSCFVLLCSVAEDDIVVYQIVRRRYDFYGKDKCSSVLFISRNYGNLALPTRRVSSVESHYLQLLMTLLTRESGSCSFHWMVGSDALLFLLNVQCGRRRYRDATPSEYNSCEKGELTFYGKDKCTFILFISRNYGNLDSLSTLS
ncbi:hypothetical protein CEXT_54901 [Caerostris extrusa]|uniref:Uncharacterized protein n=1 Tax=Caerostris extrusa TaxID=172846 RepID=A0AAV4R413_CAEEX|nr:hypothetical protein CEXT_54901 [Caerostris extrusa]